MLEFINSSLSDTMQLTLAEAIHGPICHNTSNTNSIVHMPKSALTCWLVELMWQEHGGSGGRPWGRRRPASIRLGGDLRQLILHLRHAQHML